MLASGSSVSVVANTTSPSCKGSAVSAEDATTILTNAVAPAALVVADVGTSVPGIKGSVVAAGGLPVEGNELPSPQAARPSMTAHTASGVRIFMNVVIKDSPLYIGLL
jgi:hypothetical protein